MNECPQHPGRTEFPCHLCLETFLSGLNGRFVHVAGEITDADGSLQAERILFAYHTERADQKLIGPDTKYSYMRFGSLHHTPHPEVEPEKKQMNIVFDRDELPDPYEYYFEKANGEKIRFDSSADMMKCWKEYASDPNTVKIVCNEVVFDRPLPRGIMVSNLAEWNWELNEIRKNGG